MTDEKIKNISNWTKISDSQFRYVIAAKVAYEILVEFWFNDTPIETAKASLCITGYWHNKNTSDSIEREWLGKELPIQELLEIAYEDNKQNS